MGRSMLAIASRTTRLYSSVAELKTRMETSNAVMHCDWRVSSNSKCVLSSIYAFQSILPHFGLERVATTAGGAKLRVRGKARPLSLATAEQLGLPASVWAESAMDPLDTV